MTRHAMHYVLRLDRVQEELQPKGNLADEFAEVGRALVKAESALVRAYGEWRDLMKKVSPESPRAARYVEESVWDLT